MFKVFDILIILTMAWFGFKGIKKGIIYEIFSIIALLAGGWGAIYLNKYTLSLLGIESEVGHLVSLVVTFLACVVIVFIVGKFLKISLSFIFPEAIDKLLGLVFGVFKVLFFAGIILYYTASIDKNEVFLGSDTKENMLLFKPSYKTAELLLPKIQTAHELFKGKNPLKENDSIQEVLS
ncbi:MAG: CvpA family protein [Bacteroidales bacterium]|nr:CvpA family protein [Bacteroidales bacterium]